MKKNQIFRSPDQTVTLGAIVSLGKKHPLFLIVSQIDQKNCFRVLELQPSDTEHERTQSIHKFSLSNSIQEIYKEQIQFVFRHIDPKLALVFKHVILQKKKRQEYQKRIKAKKEENRIYAREIRTLGIWKCPYTNVYFW